MNTKALLMIIFSALVFGCSPDSGAGEGIKEEVTFEFEQKERTITAGDSFDLFTVLKQVNVKREDIQWGVDNNNIASLSGSVVKGVSGGETIITAKIKNTNYLTRMKLIVRQAKLKFRQDKLELIVNKNYDLSKLLDFSGVEINQLNWVTSDNSIATVDNSGVVYGRGEGEVKVVVYVKGTSVKAEIRLIVFKDQLIDIVFESETIEMYAMENASIPFKTIPEGASLEGTVWNVDGLKRIRVVKPGVLYGDMLETGTLVVTLPNGRKKSVTIEVVSKGISEIRAPYGLNIDMYEGSKERLEFVLFPIGEDYEGLEFKVDNSIVSVDKDGMIQSTVGKRGIVNLNVRSKKNPSVSLDMKIEVRSFAEYVYVDINFDIDKYTGDLYSGQGEISIYKMAIDDFTISNFKILDGNKKVIYNDSGTYRLDHYYTVSFDKVYKPYMEFTLTFKGEKVIRREELKAQIFGDYRMILGYK